jgi:ubiquinone biosynthesis protein
MQSSSARGREVAMVLIRHGLHSLLDVLDLRVLLPGPHHPPPGASHHGPVHLRHALEDLGPTFVKLGQVLSTRPDLMPPDYETELARLQDAAPTVPPRDIISAVENALGRNLREAFARFELAPLAAASIGQVHAATLPDGTDVVVKVRRPHVLEQVHIDLDLLDRLAAVMARRSAVAARYDPVGLAREFGTTLLGELDYIHEGKNAELLAAGFDNEPGVHIPKVYWDYTRVGVITEERIRGIKIDDTRALDERGIDRRAVARRFADAYLSMVFVRGFFHADPHPGNIFVESAQRIGLVDFGMVGEVAPQTRRDLGTILLALVANDPSRMADGLLRLGIACDDVNRLGLEQELAGFLARYTGIPLERLRIGPLLTDLMRVVRAHRLRLPSDLALLLKTVMMCEGVAAQLDPSFELVPILVPYANQPAHDDDRRPDAQGSGGFDT